MWNPLFPPIFWIKNTKENPWFFFAFWEGFMILPIIENPFFRFFILRYGRGCRQCTLCSCEFRAPAREAVSTPTTRLNPKIARKLCKFDSKLQPKKKKTPEKTDFSLQKRLPPCPLPPPRQHHHLFHGPKKGPIITEAGYIWSQKGQKCVYFSTLCKFSIWALKSDVPPPSKIKRISL